MPTGKRKRYKATVDWQGYEGDKIIVPACVRSPSVRGRNFEATVKATAEKIPHGIIMVCDTLDAHNLVGRNDNPRKEAIKLADEWLKTTEPVIKKYFESYEIHRWQDVQADSTYDRRLELVQQLYDSDNEVTEIIDGFALKHNLDKKERMASKGLSFSLSDEMKRSASYLIDEVAGDAVYRDWFPDIPEAYNGAYFANADLFNETNDINPSIDLTIPVTLPVTLNRLPKSTVIEDCRHNLPAELDPAP